MFYSNANTSLKSDNGTPSWPALFLHLCWAEPMYKAGYLM